MTTTNERCEIQKRRRGSAKHKTPIQLGPAQHKLQWIDRQLEEQDTEKPEAERRLRENPKAARRTGEAQCSYPTKLGTAQTSLDLLAIGWMKPP